MKKIDVCPSTLKSGFETYSPEARRKMFNGRPVSHILLFESPGVDEEERVVYAEHVGRISLSGVQPKGGLVIDDNDQLVRPAEGLRSRYILKPAPSSYALLAREFCPANENYTMQLASQVYGIETAANALCFFRSGEAAYLTRRFDVAPGGEKFLQEDFASLAGLTKVNGGSDYKYSNLSYEECAGIIRRYVTAAQIDILRFFQIVVFNYITLNDDAHLKNFTLISRNGKESRIINHGSTEVEHGSFTVKSQSGANLKHKFAHRLGVVASVSMFVNQFAQIFTLKSKTLHVFLRNRHCTWKRKRIVSRRKCRIFGIGHMLLHILYHLNGLSKLLPLHFL